MKTQGTDIPLQYVLSTLADSTSTASLIDKISISADQTNDQLILRGIEAGPGISVSLTNIPNSTEQKITIGLSTLVTPTPTPPSPPGQIPPGTYLNPTLTVNQYGQIVSIQNGVSALNIGEINTCSNIGSGAGIFAVKSNVDLQFKSIVAGQGVHISEFSDEVVISVPVQNNIINSINNTGVGTTVCEGINGQSLTFKTLVAGSGITITDFGDSILISSSPNITYNVNETFTKNVTKNVTYSGEYISDPSDDDFVGGQISNRGETDGDLPNQTCDGKTNGGLNTPITNTINIPNNYTETDSEIINTNEWIDNDINTCYRNTGMTKEYVDTDCIVIVPNRQQIMVYGSYEIDGILLLQGNSKLVIL